MKLFSLVNLFFFMLVFIDVHRCENFFWSRYSMTEEHTGEFEKKLTKQELLQKKRQKIAQELLYDRVSSTTFLKDLFSGRY